MFACLALAQAAVRPALAVDRAACTPHLTFRWAAGGPVPRPGDHDPSARALGNEPFLRDPEILSVTTGKDWLGFYVRMTLGLAPAQIMLRQTSKHLDEFLVVMLGNIVIAAPWVTEPVSNIAQFAVPFKVQQFYLAAMLKTKSAGCTQRE